MIIHDEIRLALKVCMVTMYLNNMGRMYLSRTLALFMIHYYEKLDMCNCNSSSVTIRNYTGWLYHHSDGYFACMVAFNICLLQKLRMLNGTILLLSQKSAIHHVCNLKRSLKYLCNFSRPFVFFMLSDMNIVVIWKLTDRK